MYILLVFVVKHTHAYTLMIFMRNSSTSQILNIPLALSILYHDSGLRKPFNEVTDVDKCVSISAVTATMFLFC